MVTEENALPDWVTQGTEAQEGLLDESLMDSVEDKEVEQDVVLPAQKNVDVEFKDVSFKELAEGAIKKMHLTSVLINGVKYKGEEGKYKNKHIFQDILISFDTQKYGKDSGMYKYSMAKGLVPWKTLRNALGIKSPDPVGIKGAKVKADLMRGFDKWTDKNTGEEKSKNFNYLTNFKASENGVTVPE